MDVCHPGGHLARLRFVGVVHAVIYNFGVAASCSEEGGGTGSRRDLVIPSEFHHCQHLGPVILEVVDVPTRHFSVGACVDALRLAVRLGVEGCER